MKVCYGFTKNLNKNIHLQYRCYFSSFNRLVPLVLTIRQPFTSASCASGMVFHTTELHFSYSSQYSINRRNINLARLNEFIYMQIGKRIEARGDK